jgi:hypothetical protein
LLVDAVANNNGVGGNADETVVDARGVCVEDLRNSRSLYCASLVQVMTSTAAPGAGAIVTWILVSVDRVLAAGT